MKNRRGRPFLETLLIDAQVIESDGEPEPAMTSAQFGSFWHWPSGSRRLLATLLSISAIAMYLGERATQTDGTATNVVPTLVLEANTAPGRVLGALPRVGPALVRQWTAARELRPFESLDDLEIRIRGLGPVGMGRIAPHVRINHVPGLSDANAERTNAAASVMKTRTARKKRTRGRAGARTEESASIAKPPAE